MANQALILSLNDLFEIEGLWSNLELDHGKETFRGISREFWSNWNGWKIIDKYKGKSDFLKNIKTDRELEDLVIEFYDKEFWSKFCGDFIPVNLASEMFECSVNIGSIQSIKFLQRALNALNKNGKLWKNINEDGIMKLGGDTMLALREYILLKEDPTILLKVLNILQGNYYLDILRKDEGQEIFIRGWLKRVKF